MSDVQIYIIQNIPYAPGEEPIFYISDLIDPKKFEPLAAQGKQEAQG